MTANLGDDPYLSPLIGQLNLLSPDLLDAENITTAEEWLLEYPGELSMMAATLSKIYTDLQDITDPTIIASPYYKALMADFTTKTSPSIAHAAGESDLTDLANVMALLTNSSPPQFNLKTLEGDVNIFVHYFGDQ